MSAWIWERASVACLLHTAPLSLAHNSSLWVRVRCIRHSVREMSACVHQTYREYRTARSAQVPSVGSSAAIHWTRSGLFWSMFQDHSEAPLCRDNEQCRVCAQCNPVPRYRFPLIHFFPKLSWNVYLPQYKSRLVCRKTHRLNMGGMNKMQKPVFLFFTLLSLPSSGLGFFWAAGWIKRRVHEARNAEVRNGYSLSLAEETDYTGRWKS